MLSEVLAALICKNDKMSLQTVMSNRLAKLCTVNWKSRQRLAHAHIVERANELPSAAYTWRECSEFPDFGLTNTQTNTQTSTHTGTFEHIQANIRTHTCSPTQKIEGRTGFSRTRTGGMHPLFNGFITRFVSNAHLSTIFLASLSW